MNDKYVAQAPTQEEAIQKGLDALGITKDEAIIRIDEPGKKGFLGIGQRDAVVTVERKEKTNLVDDFLADELNIKRSNKTIESVKTKETSQPVVVPEEADTATFDQKEKDSLKEKALQEEADMDKEEKLIGRDQSEVELVGEKQVTQSEVADMDEDYDNEDFDDEDDDDDYEEKDSSQMTEEEVYEKDQEAIEEVRQYLKDVIVAMGIEDVEVFTSRVKNNVKYDIETENAGLVIGRHGKVLNGLQTLAQNHMHQLAYSKINVRADAEKYRERRKSTVENLANRTADRVIKTNKPVRLDPMPAHERKQIHRYLNQNPKVKTHSEGREPKRYLVVEPNND